MHTVEFFSVYLGESITRGLVIKNQDKTPYDLTGVTEIQVRFKKSDGSALVKNMVQEGPLPGGVTIVDAVRGQIQVELTPAETQLLKVGERQDFTVAMFRGEVAQASTGGITFLANEPGTKMNGVKLEFDGVKTVQQVVDAYNDSVEQALEVHFNGSPAAVLAVQTVTLNGGSDDKRIAVFSKALSVLKAPV